MKNPRAPRRDSTPLIYTVFFLLPLCSCLIGTQLNQPTVAVALALPQIAAAAWTLGITGAITSSIVSILGWYVLPMMGRIPLESVDHNSAILGTVIALAYGLLVNSLHTTIERAHLAAGTDSLTGLLNRGGFIERINNELNRGARMGGVLAIGFIDCDHFKKFNDTHGHLAGDEFLISTARRLRQSVRSYDGVARFGGDEYALLFPEVDPDKIDIIIRRIHDQLQSMVRDSNWPISFSMGVVVFMHRRPVEEMLRTADETMYEVKHAGKNNYRIRIDDTPADEVPRPQPAR